MNQNTKKNFQKRMEAVFAPWVCAHLNSTASGVTHKTPAAAMAARAVRELDHFFYVPERCAAAQYGRAAGRPRALAGALASRAGWLRRQLKGLQVRLRAFSTWPQIFCLTAFLLPLAARRAMLLILRRQASTLK